MADEFRIVKQVTLTNGNDKFDFSPAVHTPNQSAVGRSEVIYNIGTSEESITSFSEISTQGRCIIHNLDTTNFVDIGFSTGVYGMSLEANDFIEFKMKDGADLFLKADTASVEVRIVVFEA